MIKYTDAHNVANRVIHIVPHLMNNVVNRVIHIVPHLMNNVANRVNHNVDLEQTSLKTVQKDTMDENVPNSSVKHKTDTEVKQSELRQKEQKLRKS